MSRGSFWLFSGLETRLVHDAGHESAAQLGKLREVVIAEAAGLHDGADLDFFGSAAAA
jgi:hypothetical protein